MMKGHKLQGVEVKLEKRLTWKDDEQLLLNDKICQFNVQYLGAETLDDSTQGHLFEQAMKKLITKKKRLGTLKICVYSIVWQDAGTNVIILDQTMRKVILCETYPTVPYSFFYISEDTSTNGCQLYGFLSCKEVSERITHAINYAMQIFLERESDKSKMPKCEQLIQEDTDTTFKQASLAEKYRDPQSSIIVHNLPMKISKTFTDLKSIPRRKGSKTVDGKVCLDDFTRLNQDDILKPFEVKAGSVDSTFANFVFPTDVNFDEIFKESRNSKNVPSSNWSSEEKLQNVLHINEIFHVQNPITKKPEYKLKSFPEPYFEEQGSSQNSRYDSFRNLNNKEASGWSDQIVRVNVQQPKLSKSYNGLLDQISIENIFNTNLLNTQKNIHGKNN